MVRIIFLNVLEIGTEIIFLPNFNIKNTAQVSFTKENSTRKPAPFARHLLSYYFE